MDQVQFLDILAGSLSEFEVSRLSQQFGVDYYALPGESKRDRIWVFLGILYGQARLEGLAEAAVALRPDLAEKVAQLFGGDDDELAWLDQVAQGSVEPVDSGITWRWLDETPASDDSPSADVPEKLPSVGPLGSSPSSLAEARTLPYQPIGTARIRSKSSLRISNPYTPGRQVTDERMFFGRAAELAFGKERLLADEHVALAGPRLFGSSSLLYALRGYMTRDVPTNVLTAYVNMKDPANHSVATLLNGVWTQWWQAVKPGQSVRAETLAEFVTAVRKLHAAGFRLLLLLDEFEQLVWRKAIFDDHLLNAWHELGREGLLRFGVSGHTTPSDLLAQSGSSSVFYELFHPLTVGLMDEFSARDLLTVPMDRDNLTIPDGAVNRCLALAGPHPFFLQLAGYYLYEGMSRGDYSDAQFDEQFSAAAMPYWQEIWDSLSPLAQAHYPLEPVPADDANGVTSLTTSSVRQLRILANRGLVRQGEDVYRPLSEGFAGYLHRIKSAGEAAAAAAARLQAV